MTGLKTLVVTMGFLIVVGIALVGYGLTRTKPAFAPSPAGAFAVDVQLRQGDRLAAVTSAGDRIVLHFNGSEGDRLVLLDAHSGQIAGTIALVPGRN